MWRYPVSEDVRDWIEENFLWAVDNDLLTPDTQLVLPTETFFKAQKGKPEEVAAAVFDDLRRLLDLEDAEIDLVPMDIVSEEYRNDYNALSGVGGTWQGGDRAVIRYDPAMTTRPLTLLSTLSHELMHHVLHSVEEYPPGGAETEELATDLHVITMGLGVIAMAGAEQAGWQGYMTQPSRAHALALFLAARGIDAERALRHLPARSGKYVARAQKFLRKHPETSDQLAALLKALH